MNGELSDNIWEWRENEPVSGAWNMAADQFFAESMPTHRRPIMRLYQWQPWCISLGYHQSADRVDLNACRKEGIDVVRRQTGGRAVFHAEEITYSVILPRNHSLCISVSNTYRQISQGLAAGLRLLGVPASFQKRAMDMKAHYERKISMDCFSAAALHEIVVDGRKLVGSAQRRLQSGVIQHGSILVGAAHLRIFHYLNGLSAMEKEHMVHEMSRKTIHLKSILDPGFNHASISSALKKGMEEEFGIEFRDKTLTLTENQEIEDRKNQFIILMNT